MTNIRIDSLAIHQVSIPFQLSFDHATARRNACDSLIWVARSGEHLGVGEAVLREYVSGSHEGRSIDAAADITKEIVSHNFEEGVSLEMLESIAADHTIPALSLPIYCGVETAMLDLLCDSGGCDIYDLLGVEPVRSDIRYGGIVPILDDAGTERVIATYRDLGVEYLRIKVGGVRSDVCSGVRNDRGKEYRGADSVDIARRMLGDSFDLRIDANGSWQIDSATDLVPLFVKRGVKIIEEPIGRDFPGVRALKTRFPEVHFAADESLLTMGDLKMMRSLDNYDMVNIRASKNGGLLRCLHLATESEKLGIRYQLGCHVGETAVLSAVGRVAASLMADPLYVDGSYDRYLLTGNIARDDISFGSGGLARIIRGRGLGYGHDLSLIDRWSVERHDCL